MSHLNQHADVAAELAFVCTDPFVFFFAVQEGHEGWSGADLIFGADFIGFAQVNFD